MRVLLMAPFYPAVGGITTWASELASIENDYVTFIKLNEANTSKYRNCFVIDVLRCFRIWRELKQNLKNSDIDIVHINIPANSLSMLRELVSIRVIHRFNKKAIVHFHCTLPTIIRSKIQYHLFEHICSKADGIITLNSRSLEYEKSINKDVVNIPNFTTEIMLEVGGNRIVNENVSKVLFVGNVIEDKGCIDLIKVAKCLPQYEFRFVGKVGIDTDELDVPNNVIFTGKKSGLSLVEEYKNADVFAFLSHMPAEGFSVSLTEAMASGLPCVVTDWAANKDMIENRGGIVVSHNDINGMVDAFKKIGNYELRKQMAIWNVLKVKHNYTLPMIFQQIYCFYEDILRKA
jgi:glycosyltransferase involved in cell wall biosynthesis